MIKKSLDGSKLEKDFDVYLASFAQKNSTSRGRKFQEPPDPFRLPFQRDKARIIHTTSFRRLNRKTQVVPSGFGDHFRNRLTHTLEVALVAKDLARQLRLNEDLAEAVALAHDIGHPPFGHMGEHTLNEKMQEHGLYFDHNKQSLRVVEVFETRYPDFQGLNLSLEVLEGIQKHQRSFARGKTKITWPHLESQLVDISDEISYLSADLEDGLRGEFFTFKDLQKLKICARAFADIPEAFQKHRPSFIRKIIGELIAQVVQDSKSRIKQFNIKTLSDVQSCPYFIIGFEPSFYKEFLEVKQFLFDRYYSHPKVRKLTKEGQELLKQAFDYLVENPQKIPKAFHPEENLYQRICDYLAGMTDDYLREFVKNIA